MGTIYRNGVPFVGSGGAGGVEMTQAEYDLLPESEKMNGAIYFITDGDVSYPSASQMRYDNTESQIPSTTVQGAIDENRIEINAINAGLIVTEAKTSSAIEIEANGRGVFTIDVSKAGYTPIGIIQIALANNWMYLGGYNITGTSATVVIHNGYGRSAGSQTVYLTVLYRKN